jgi:choline dehydrogenase
MERFDVIIVGAGSAGSVLAERLSADGRRRVLVLEAGGRDRSPWIHLPVGYGKLFHHPRLNWRHRTEPQEALAGRRDYWPRGRVAGGSGAINALVYCRGLASDFDDWAAAGAAGWGWADVAPVFERLETHVARDGARRGAGRIHVTDVSGAVHPVNRHFFAALRALQLPVTDDINGPAAEGGAVYRLNTRGGRRCGSGQAHLCPALRRRNLALRTGALAERVLIEDGRAAGVVYHRRGARHEARAGQVILAAGAVRSPQLLQLSGIGPAALLARHGIAPILDNPNVGGHLQDHLAIDYAFRAREPTLNDVLRPWHGKARAALRYALCRDGPLALSVNQCGGFLRSAPERARPDQQLYFNPVTYTTMRSGRRTVIHPDSFPGFVIAAQPARPTSRGRIDIRGPDPHDAPAIRPNALATEADRAAAVDGIRLLRRIMAAPPLARLADAAIGPDLRTIGDEAAMLEDFRARAATVYHPVGTCRMGADPSTAVTDPRCRVFGVAGLRVVDASAFPNVTSGNTNAPTMMLADRAADLFLEDLRA